MKRFFVNQLVIAALVVAAAFTSCGKDENGDKVKLLETIVRDDGSYLKFEYDNQNRITKVSRYHDGEISWTETYTYNSAGDLVKVASDDGWEGEYVRNANTITLMYDGHEEGSVIINDNGYPIKVVQVDDGCDDLDEDDEYGCISMIEFIFTFDSNNNVTKVTYVYDGVDDGGTEFKYDNTKSPFYHCKTPKWALILFFLEEYEIGFTNNVIEANAHGGLVKYEYKFNADGYPTERTATAKDEDGDEVTWIETFTYK